MTRQEYWIWMENYFNTRAVGSIIRDINGEDWLKVDQQESMHTEGLLVSLSTGKFTHWTVPMFRNDVEE